MKLKICGNLYTLCGNLYTLCGNLYTLCGNLYTLVFCNSLRLRMLQRFQNSLDIYRYL